MLLFPMSTVLAEMSFFKSKIKIKTLSGPKLFH